MKQQHADYQVVPYPQMRRLEAIAYRSVQHKPMIHGLLEVDVTRARALLREYKAITGEPLSFTAFLIACLAKAVEEHKAVQAYRKGSKHLIVFDEVDVYTPIERDVAGQKQLIPCIIRAANPQNLSRDSSRDPSSPNAGRGKSQGGLQSRPLALAAVAPILSSHGMDS
jgi:Pyruvate/2-oxoglutarate dehydrogenase complex, dihydrolipoamide acyltransferase (E2) component, and related enzymes